MSAPDGFRHFERLRVRRSEVDMDRIVFSSHYLAWFDSAIAGYWRALALPYRETMARLQGELRVRKAALEYEGSAHHEDVLTLCMRCARIGRSSIVIECACLREGQWLVRGELVYVFVDPSTGRAKAVPPALREALLGYEAGEPAVSVRLGSWADLQHDAGPIRTAVFVEEQGIPAEMEWDAADAGCLHAVAYNRLGVPLATGRLLEHVPGTAKIGRMAVLSSVRGGGIGRAVLDALMDAARARGDREVLLHAQTSAAPFYLRAGFQPRGPQFDEAGIAHVEMVRGL
ncbi:MAG TPA: GNAT family N-acetyltransferase [Rubrivivax sp.]|nr:GNAT family N-acetyltransferase [Rubrivivax sp.]